MSRIARSALAFRTAENAENRTESTKCNQPEIAPIRHSDFVIASAFGIRHSPACNAMRGIAGMAFGISAHPYSVAMRWQRIWTKWQNFGTTFLKKS
jgi:hypothetical protein